MSAVSPASSIHLLPRTVPGCTVSSGRNGEREKEPTLRGPVSLRTGRRRHRIRRALIECALPSVWERKESLIGAGRG